VKVTAYRWPPNPCPPREKLAKNNPLS